MANKPTLEDVFNNISRLVNNYRKRYYYQYRGETYDLAMDYFIQVLTPPEGMTPSPSMLDNLYMRYDPSKNDCFYAWLKTVIVHKLIDSSRRDKQARESLEDMMFDFGLGSVCYRLGLVEEEDERPSENMDIIPSSDIVRAKGLWESMSFKKRKYIIKMYRGNKAAVSTPLGSLIQELMMTTDSGLLNTKKELKLRYGIANQ